MTNDSAITSPGPELDPADEGKTHINVYSGSRERLGRLLTNFADCNLTHPFFGSFRNIEGLWWYMRTGFCDERFRVVRGHTAREMGKAMPTEFYPQFNRMIKLGLLCKLESNQELQKLLIANELPLTHYYAYGGKVVRDLGGRHKWQLDFWNLLRTTLISTGNLDIIRDELMDTIRRDLEQNRAESKE